MHLAACDKLYSAYRIGFTISVKYTKRPREISFSRKRLTLSVFSYNESIV